MEIEKLTFDDTEILQSLDKVDKMLTRIADDGEAAGKALDSAMAEAQGAIDGATASIEGNAEAVAKQRAALESANKNLSAWRNLLKQSADGLAIGGKTIGEWRGQLAQSRATLQQLTTTTQGMSAAQKAFNLILRASPIFIVVAVLTAVVAWFSRFQKVTDAVRGSMAAASAVMEVVVKRVTMLGDALLAVFRGDWAAATDKMAGAFTGLGAAIGEAATRAIELERRTYALQKAQIESSLTTARQAAAIEQLQRTAEDETLSTIERERARREAMQLSNDMAKRRESLAKEALDIAQNELLIENKKLEALIRSGASEADIIEQRKKAREEDTNLGIEGRERLRDAEIELFDVQKENEAALQELNKIGREIEEKRAEEAEKAREKKAKQLEYINKILAENNLLLASNDEAKALAEVNKRFDEQVQKTRDALAIFDELAKKRGLTPEQIKQKEALAAQEKALEDQRLSALLEVGLEYAEKQSEIENAKRRKLQESERAAALQSVADLQKLGDLQIDEAEAIRDRYLKVLESRGASESELASEQAEFDKTIQRARLQNQLTFLENSLALTDTADAAAIEQLKQQIENVKILLGTLDVPDEGGDKPKTIWDMLGITSEDEKEAAKQAISQIQDSLNSLAETRIQSAEKAVEARQKEVDALEEALDKEKELQEKGLANNVALREKELQTAKLQRDKALKDEAKARRAAILLDSVQQVSGLITASANIFKTLSGIPFVGIPLAVATIGLMFGAFAKAKSQALKAAEAPKLRRGAKIKGRTHEQGGELFELERDEWVIGTEHSREHDRFLAAMNRGEYKGVDLAELATRHKRGMNPVSAMMPGIDFATAQRKEAEHAMQFGIMRSAYEQGANRIVEAIEGKEVVMPFKDGYRIQRKKGNTKTVETFLPA